SAVGVLGRAERLPSPPALAAPRPANPSPLEPLEPAGLAASGPEDTSPLERILQFRIASREIRRKVGTAAAQNVENRTQACVFFHGVLLLLRKSFAHSITSSAMARIPGGRVRPRTLAVLRLITSSNLVDR